LSETQKGHMTCWLKEYKVFVEISPKGKVIVYYGRHDDRSNAIRILLGSEKKLIACDDFVLVKDLPRTLKAVQEGIEANLEDVIDLEDLINSEPIRNLNYDNYILPTASPKTYKMVSEGISKYLTKLVKTYKYNIAVELMESTTEWIVTFGMEITEEIFPNLTYVETCDKLTEELTSVLERSHYKFVLDGDDRDGEGLSVRYTFVWRPSDGPIELPKFPYEEYWETLELAPAKEIYPDSD